MISSIQSSVSALRALGKKMGVTSNNIANANTPGFKSKSGIIQDLPSQSVSTMSGTSQVGRGAALGDIYASFEQGGFEPTENPTDLAIGGSGFFVMREEGGDGLFYSRAGNFRFDRDGYLTNPEGYVVQGRQLDGNGNPVGSLRDIRMDTFTSPPQASTNIRMITNLDANATVHPGSLEAAWDGTRITGPYLADNAYEYQSTVNVHDSLGNTHDINIFFDKTAPSQWEYAITCNPAEDGRAGASGTPCAGLLAKGTLSFSDSSGTILPSGGLTMQTFNGTDWTDPANPANWTDAAPSASGFPEFSPDFVGGTGTQMDVALDFGSYSESGLWVNDSLTTTQFAGSSSTRFQSADGFGAGDLQGVSVDVDGVMTGTYSNGEIVPLFQVSLADFNNPQGLRMEGGNLFRATRESGDAMINSPGTGGLGSIAPNSLEGSNVDLAKEITDTIPVQNGYEANLTVIKTRDEMLGTILDILG